MTAHRQPRPSCRRNPAAGGVTSPGQAGAPAPEGDSPPARPTFLDRQWRIEFPPGQELLNANDRIHWSKRSRITKQLRSDAHLMARYLKIPRLARIQVDGIYEPPDKRRRDAGNWLATYKAQIDGLVDAGVVEDDDHTRVHGPFPWIGDLFPMGRIVLVITELEPLT